ncbi:GNAT family N-acetyltransferase [uncultured Tateyamaria sp.]|uniref:GNAT family N-acetyltransferase n=1 Tax=Tateyamaria sp. 1078 TaxID=3417464 RepID=UPI002630E83F|nr:GNAT family N-acetyltransferase [uncultured Tateyamaria sp.]
MLADGFHEIPRGKVAMVVTTLEMRTKMDIRPVTPPAGWELVRHTAPAVKWYRDLFRAVGQDWLWYGRSIISDATLSEIIHDPKVHIYTLQKDGVDGGLLELDFREAGQCELAYFGLAPALIGSGAGRFLMNNAIELAWAQAITRFHLHTCTIDSPQALPFYRRSGFVPVSQKFELADDPRIAHGYDRGLAPHIPIFDP